MRHTNKNQKKQSANSTKKNKYQRKNIFIQGKSTVSHKRTTIKKSYTFE